MAQGEPILLKGVIFFTEPNNLSLWGDIAGIRNTLTKLVVDFYIVVDQQNIIPDWNDEVIESYRVSTFQEALDKLEQIHPECETVWLTSEATTELKDFDHPTNACYVMGADSGGTVYTTADHNVKIYGPNLFAAIVIGIVLYDRIYMGY